MFYEVLMLKILIYLPLFRRFTEYDQLLISYVLHVYQLK